MRRIIPIRLPNVEEIQSPFVGDEVPEAIKFVDDTLHFVKPKHSRQVIGVVGSGSLLLKVSIQAGVIPTLGGGELNVLCEAEALKDRPSDAAQ